MKKKLEKLFVSFMLLIPSVTCMAQNRWSVKPMVGGVLSTYVGEDTKGLKQRMGFTAGAEVGYSLSPKFGLSLGLSYTQQGCVLDKDRRPYVKGVSDITDANEDFYLRTKYVSVPLLAEFHIAKGLALKAGLQANFLHHATETYTVLINRNQNAAQGESFKEGEWYSEERYDNWKPKMKSVDITIPIGLSYEYAGVVVDARYHIGLSHPLSGLDDFHGHFYEGKTPLKARTSMLTLTVGYKFEL
jgi:hypothetical protein